MTRFRTLTGFAALLTIAATGLPVWAAEAPTGIYYDDSGRGAVRIYECGSSLCGRIVWLQQPISATSGKPLRDARNPQPRMRQRPICGLRVIVGLRRQVDGSWDAGRIYDPKVGRTYDVALTPIDRQRIEITGYLGLRMLGKSFVWRRAPDTLAVCAKSDG